MTQIYSNDTDLGLARKLLDMGFLDKYFNFHLIRKIETILTPIMWLIFGKIREKGCFFYETIYKNIKTRQRAAIGTPCWVLCGLWKFLNFHSAAHNHML